MYIYRITKPLKTNYYLLEKDSIITATYNLQDKFEFAGHVDIIGMLRLPRLFILQNKGKPPEDVISALIDAQDVCKKFIDDAEKIKGVLRSVIRSNKKEVRK